MSESEPSPVSWVEALQTVLAILKTREWTVDEGAIRMDGDGLFIAVHICPDGR